MPQTTVSVEKTVEVAHTMGDLAASAIHHIADALELVNESVATRWRMNEVRQLADAIVKLDAPEPPKGRTGPIVFSRSTRQRPDGTFETRDRLGYGRESTTPEPDLSTPTPRCDTPYCDCATGEDCKANGAAAEVVTIGVDVGKDGVYATAYAWTLTRDHLDGIGDTLKLSDGREVIQFSIPKGLGYGAMKEMLQVLWRGLDGTIPICRPKRDSAENLPPRTPAPTLSERMLDAVNGLSAKIDALAERLPETDAHMVRVVMPSTVDREGEFETWVLDPAYQGHDAPFAMGDAITNSSAYAGIWQVLSVGQRYSDKRIELRIKRHPGFVFDTEAF